MAYVGTPIDTTNQFQSLQGKRFSGDGSTTAFTLDIAPSSVFDIEVYVENVRQDPNSAYSLSGTTLTFSAAPSSGTNNIYVIHQAKAVGTITAGAGTVNADSFDNTVISGHTALAAAPATTDEFLISDGGTIKRIDYSVLGATPAFSAYLSADQSASDGTWTKIQFNTEILDTNGTYDNSTNYRFTPGVTGYYLINAGVSIKADNANTMLDNYLSLYKNGSAFGLSKQYGNSSEKSNWSSLSLNIIINVTSASDYYECFSYADVTSGAIKFFGDSAQQSAYFNAIRIIGA